MTPPTEAPPPPTYDYLVTGTLNPDATGQYSEAGVYDGEPYYERDDNTFVLWWDSVYTRWIINDNLGNTGRPGFWSNHTIEGDYEVHWYWSGTATVTAA